MSEVVQQIIKECDEEGISEISIYDSLLTIDDLIYLRSLFLNITWKNAQYSLIDSDYSLEFLLELVNWIGPEECKIIELDYKADDRLLTELKNRGFQIIIANLCSDQFQYPPDIVRYIDCHKLIGSSVFVQEDDHVFLTEYCQLSGCPFRPYQRDIPYYPLTDNLNKGCYSAAGDHRLIRCYNFYDRYGDYLDVRGVYTSLKHPSICKDHEEQGFLLLVNLDTEMEYCTKKKFRDYWDLLDYDRITNRKAIQYLQDLGRDIITIEDILEQYDELDEEQLRLAYMSTDLIESFNHLDKLISLGTDDPLVASIIVRLLRNRLIDLKPYLDDPFLEHLYQFQHRPKIKSARNKI